MYELSRLRGVLCATLVVLGALAGLSVLANTTLGGRPTWLARGDSTIEGGQERIVASRIAGALSADQGQPGLDRPRLGVILGSSAVGMGIDPSMLEAEGGDRLPKRWLSLFANGANLADLRDLAEYLLPNTLQTELLILGIHPGLLARSDNYLSDRRSFDLDGLRHELTRRQILGVRDELQDQASVPLNWAFPNRTRVSNYLRGQVSRLKRRTALGWGFQAGHLYAADRNPWKIPLLIPDEPSDVREAAAEGRTANVRDQVEGPMRDGRLGQINDKGWNEPTAYSSTNENAQALADIIRQIRSASIEVDILILPEASQVRAATPPEAMQALRTVLAESFAHDPPPLIDLRDALRDDEFHDSIHPNRMGRQTLTKKLVEALRTRPGTHP